MTEGLCPSNPYIGMVEVFSISVRILRDWPLKSTCTLSLLQDNRMNDWKGNIKEIY